MLFEFIMTGKFILRNCVRNKFPQFSKCLCVSIEKFGAKITALSTNLSKIANKRQSVAENMIVIIKPLTTLELLDSLPTGAEYMREVVQLIQNLTQLERKNFQIEEDSNPWSGEPDCQHVFVTLPSKEYVDRVYQAQPFFGCLIVHKISHIQICSFRRYSANQCLMCSSKKNSSCLNDMCSDCCPRQKYGTLVCRCSIDSIQSLMADRKKKLQALPFEREKDRLFEEKSTRSESLCEKCPNDLDKGCSNTLCAVCCPIQAIRSKCPVHDKSFYSRKLESE